MHKKKKERNCPSEESDVRVIDKLLINNKYFKYFNLCNVEFFFRYQGIKTERPFDDVYNLGDPNSFLRFPFIVFPIKNFSYYFLVHKFLS